MRRGFSLHLTYKNIAGFLAGICVVGLAAIAVLVSSEKLPAWKTAILVLSIVAVNGLAIQMVLQSIDDNERDDRDRRLDKFLDKHAPAKLSAQSPPSATPSSEGFYVELRSTFIYPKVGDLAFQLLEGKYNADGRRPEDVTTDCDLLVDIYAVNKSTSSLYIKDFAAWLEIDGEWRKMILDDNFDLDDIWSGSVEYGLEVPGEPGEFDHEPVELPSLLSKRNAEIKSQEPSEGWLKFTAKDINPRTPYSIRIAIIDSLGEHHIDKFEKKERAIGLRRVRR